MAALRAGDPWLERAAGPVAREHDLGHAAPALVFGDLELDRRSLCVRGPGGAIDLGPGELRVFRRLAEAAGEPVPFEELTAIYGVDARNGRHALEQAISRVRVKLARRGSAVAVTTSYGIGWKLVVAS